MPGPQRYTDLKKRCDFCDKSFRAGDLIAAAPMWFEGGSRPYIMIFCFDEEVKCLRLWRFRYEVKADMDFEVMEYHGKKRGGGHHGDTGRFPAVI